MRPNKANPVLVGAIVLVVLSALTVLGFTKNIPFLNDPYTIKAAFRDGSGLKKNSPVRIAGVEVGRVTRAEPTAKGAVAAWIIMRIEDRGRPVHADATAKIRPRIFLEGNFFVDLTPGSPGPPVPEGQTFQRLPTAGPRYRP